MIREVPNQTSSCKVHATCLKSTNLIGVYEEMEIAIIDALCKGLLKLLKANEAGALEELERLKCLGSFFFGFFNF